MSPLVRFICLLVGAAGVVGLLFTVGILRWQPKPYGCFEGRGWYGDYTTVLSAGKLELRVRPYGCAPAARYDPSEWKSIYSTKSVK